MHGGVVSGRHSDLLGGGAPLRDCRELCCSPSWSVSIVLQGEGLYLKKIVVCGSRCCFLESRACRGNSLERAAESDNCAFRQVEMKKSENLRLMLASVPSLRVDTCTGCPKLPKIVPSIPNVPMSSRSNKCRAAILGGQSHITIGYVTFQYQSRGLQHVFLTNLYKTVLFLECLVPVVHYHITRESMDAPVNPSPNHATSLCFKNQLHLAVVGLNCGISILPYIEEVSVPYNLHVDL